jgi:hypothetical protein
LIVWFLGVTVIDGVLRTLDVLTVAIWAWTGVSMSLNGPSARRSCLIVRDILDVEIKFLGLSRRLRRAIKVRKVRMTVDEKK